VEVWLSLARNLLKKAIIGQKRKSVGTGILYQHFCVMSMFLEEAELPANGLRCFDKAPFEHL